MKIAAYMRISTELQSLNAQRSEIEKFTRARYSSTRVEWYSDSGISGAKVSRPGLDKLLSELERGDVLVIYKLDRLFRSLRHMIKFLERLAEINVTLVAVADSVDLSTPIGRLLVHLLSAIGEFERDVIRERIKSGMKDAKLRGKKFGRPPIKIDVVGLKRRHKEGATLRELGVEFGISKSRVWELLHPSPAGLRH